MLCIVDTEHLIILGDETMSKDKGRKAIKKPKQIKTKP